MKATLPVGVPPADETVAVNFTETPRPDGFSEEAKAVVVVAALTTWLSAFDVLPAKFESPAYVAVIELVPSGSVEVVRVAEPLLNVPVPSDAVPFRKVTVSPFGGAPALDVTVAVKVTALP